MTVARAPSGEESTEAGTFSDLFHHGHAMALVEQPDNILLNALRGMRIQTVM